MTSKHRVLLYALSTCVHCKHVMQFLEREGIPFDFVYVDSLEGKERSKTLEAIKNVNPRLSFPTLVVDDGKEVIVGFHAERLKRALSN